MIDFIRKIFFETSEEKSKNLALKLQAVLERDKNESFHFKKHS